MATVLDKDVIRESTIKSDGREIMVTLSSDQKIKFKLKGMKSGEVSIDIRVLYNQLVGVSEDDESPNGKGATVIIHDEEDSSGGFESSGVMIDLNELRSANAISTLDVPTLQKFDGIIAELLKNKKEMGVASKKSYISKTKKKRK